MLGRIFGAILGNKLPNLIMAITIPMIPRCALVVPKKPRIDRSPLLLPKLSPSFTTAVT